MGDFIEEYVFPGGELTHVAKVIEGMARQGLEVVDAEALREHYARTLRAWVANLEGSWERAVGATSAGRARVWRLYMAASAVAFERNHIGVNQVLAVRTEGRGASGMPRTRTAWLS
jgi:cyclopropane-fatty-acyl-phospholipid synthase